MEEDRRRTIASIGRIRLSKRAKRCLRRAAIWTIGDLCGRTETEVAIIKGCGPRTMADIKGVLALYDLSFKAAVREEEMMGG